MGYCGWADINERNKEYHDTEWGVPEHDDRKMFEYQVVRETKVIRPENLLSCRHTASRPPRE